MAVQTLPNVELLRKQRDQYHREVKRRIKNQDDVTATLFKIEERFLETIGLLRALEAIAEASTVETVAKVAKTIRADYKHLLREFERLESRCSNRSDRSYDERDQLVKAA